MMAAPEFAPELGVIEGLEVVGDMTVLGIGLVGIATTC